MESVAAAPADRRRTSIVVTGVIAVALIAVSILFAANTQWYFVFKMLHVGAAVVWVGGGLFLTILALLAELANDDDQLLQIGHWAETVAGRLFPTTSSG
jgi:putative copper export protein